MIRNRLVFICAMAVLTLLIFVLSSVAPPRGYAQDDPTQLKQTSIQQTLAAIINPRLTLTQSSANEQTATGAAGIAGTNALNMTSTSNSLTQIAAYIGTATIDALTATYTPTVSLTPSITPLAFSNLNPTDQQGTALSRVGDILTATAQQNAVLTQTAVIEGTVNSLLLQALGITATPTLMPVLTATPTDPNATPSDLDKIKIYLTLTAQAQMTLAFQSTFDKIVQATQGTATPTPTLSGAQIRATESVLLAQALTQTPQAIIDMTNAAAYQATVSNVTNGILTVTAASVRATLTSGFDLIGPTNAAKLQKSAVLLGHTASIQGVAFSPDGTEFATASLDNTVRVWNTQTGDAVFTINGLTDRIAIAFSPDGTRIAATSSDTTVRLFDAKTGTEVDVLGGHKLLVTSVTFSPDSSRVAAASLDGSVLIWDVKTGTLLLTLPPPKGNLTVNRGPITTVAFSPDGMRLASAGQDSTITIWEAKTGVQLTMLHDVQQISSIAFSSDGTMIASGGSSHQIQIWNSQTGAKIATLRGPQVVINTIAFCVDAPCIAAGTADGALWFWETSKGRMITTLKAAHTGPINSISFSPDGTRFASVGNDQKIVVWSIPSSQ